MPTLSDFNSLWEVSFAINAIFVFFDYSRHQNSQLDKILEIGDKDLKYHFAESKESLGGWSYSNVINKWFPVKYHLQKQTLRTFSVINSILSFLLLLLSAYIPAANFWLIFSFPLIVLLFGPIIYNLVHIHYIFPRAIISSIITLLESRLEKKKKNLTKEDYEGEKRKTENTIFDLKCSHFHLYFPGPKMPKSYLDIKE